MRERLLIWIRGILCIGALCAPVAFIPACEVEENPVEEAAEDVEDAVD